MSETTTLIPIESINAVEIFGADNTAMTALLDAIATEAKSHVPDVSTEEGRKAIASVAYKVARSKTTIDNAGKALVEDIKKQSGVIDKRRKIAWDYLESLQAEVKKPLTEYQAEEARKAELARQQAELELLHMEALRENDLFDREAAVKKQAAELQAKQEEQDRKDRETREAEQRRKDQEEAEERGRQQAAAALERERVAKEQAEKAAKDAQEKAERDKKEAAEKAERDKAEAVRAAEAKAKREAEEAEQRRQAEIAKKQKEDADRAADKANRDRIHGEIVAALAADGVGERTAEKILRLLVSGGVPHVTVKY